jgi:RNA 3'-terminal phosphate cyclase (ATP)
VGSAGSATLVLQTVLPALLTAPAPAVVELEGGTHNPFAPPFDFLARSFLPLVGRMGPRVEAVLERPGFYPAGGGSVRVRVEPAPRLAGFDLLERGAVRAVRATVHLSDLPRHVADRELQTAARILRLPPENLAVEEARDPAGPGNAVVVEVESEALTEVFTAFGQRGVRAERVAESAAGDAKRYIDSGVPVGDHLADQILLPLALAGGGSFRARPLSSHATTNLEVLRMFLPVEAEVEDDADGSVRVTLRTRG